MATQWGKTGLSSWNACAPHKDISFLMAAILLKFHHVLLFMRCGHLKKKIQFLTDVIFESRISCQQHTKWVAEAGAWIHLLQRNHEKILSPVAVKHLLICISEAVLFIVAFFCSASASFFPNKPVCFSLPVWCFAEHICKGGFHST